MRLVSMRLFTPRLCYDFVMIITYPSHHRWIKQVPENPLESFSHKQQLKIEDTLSRLETLRVQSEVALLNETFLEHFVPLYESRLSTMNNPALSDIRSKTLNIKERSYFSLSLWESDIFLGGTIFRIVGNELRIAYRIYAHDWHTAPLHASPSMVTEYLITKYAHEHNVPIISHGKDRNPYGLNASIGLASYKLSVGCRPLLVKDASIHTINTDELTEDALILEYPGNTDLPITHAHLITLRENEFRYAQATKYPNQLTVTTHYRDAGVEETNRA